MRITQQVGYLSAIAAVAFAAGGWILFSHRRRKGDPEVRRRALIDSRGRLIEGMVTDCRDGIVYYTWSWRGVDYEASQDLNGLGDLLPPQDQIVGPVSVKFLPNTPSNSIVMSERWSGFSTGSRTHRIA